MRAVPIARGRKARRVRIEMRQRRVQGHTTMRADVGMIAGEIRRVPVNPSRGFRHEMKTAPPKSQARCGLSPLLEGAGRMSRAICDRVFVAGRTVSFGARRWVEMRPWRPKTAAFARPPAGIRTWQLPRIRGERQNASKPVRERYKIRVADFIPPAPLLPAGRKSPEQLTGSCRDLAVPATNMARQTDLHAPRIGWRRVR